MAKVQFSSNVPSNVNGLDCRGCERREVKYLLVKYLILLLPKKNYFQGKYDSCGGSRVIAIIARLWNTYNLRFKK